MALSRRKAAFQVSPTPAGDMSQVPPSTSRQVIQVQPKSAGTTSRVQVESKLGGKVQEALPSGSSLRLRLGRGQNAKILPSTRSQMPRVETDSTDNILKWLKEENNLGSKMSQMLPGRSSQVAEEGASPSRQGVQVGPCQLLPSPNGSVLQDNPCHCPKGLLVQEFQQPGGKLVEIGSKSYFVVGGRSDWKRRDGVREIKKFQKNPRNNFK